MTMNDDAQWYVVRTQTKRERLAAGYLRALDDIEVFCPVIRYRKATRRGKVWWEEALFPSYLLARFDLDAMQNVVAYTQGVRGFVKFGSVIPAVPLWFVEELQKTWKQEAEDETLLIAPSIHIGDEVELAHGPLQGLKGSIVEVLPSNERVKVLLDFLGQPQMVDVDLFSLLLPRRPSPKGS
ncbi:MAG: hypothetical protein EAZ81_05725 [Verrucomicrobia bacterium]|jgi:transcriptional antiterminator RfaH|nr:MAG: hypothetical protein EAZ81_05725 [Verrucomicrobiota bacterium]